jgi:hypothetical protein
MTMHFWVLDRPKAKHSKVRSLFTNLSDFPENLSHYAENEKVRFTQSL